MILLDVLLFIFDGVVLWGATYLNVLAFMVYFKLDNERRRKSYTSILYMVISIANVVSMMVMFPIFFIVSIDPTVLSSTTVCFPYYMSFDTNNKVAVYCILLLNIQQLYYFKKSMADDQSSTNIIIDSGLSGVDVLTRRRICLIISALVYALFIRLISYLSELTRASHFYNSNPCQYEFEPSMLRELLLSDMVVILLSVVFNVMSNHMIRVKKEQIRQEMMNATAAQTPQINFNPDLKPPSANEHIQSASAYNIDSVGRSSSENNNTATSSGASSRLELLRIEEETVSCLTYLTLIAAGIQLLNIVLNALETENNFKMMAIHFFLNRMYGILLMPICIPVTLYVCNAEFRQRIKLIGPFLKP